MVGPSRRLSNFPAGRTTGRPPLDGLIVSGTEALTKLPLVRFLLGHWILVLTGPPIGHSLVVDDEVWFWPETQRSSLEFPVLGPILGRRQRLQCSKDRAWHPLGGDVLLVPLPGHRNTLRPD